MHTSLVTFHSQVSGIKLTLRELQEDEQRSGRSEGDSHQLGELVVRNALDQLRGHILGLFFVTKDRSKEIVTGVVQPRAQELETNVADEESRSEGKQEHYVVDGNRHHTMFSPIHTQARLPPRTGLATS